MTEKAVVCVRAGEEYELYLKDGNGGPIDLGTELTEALRKADAGQALQAVGAAWRSTRPVTATSGGGSHGWSGREKSSGQIR